MLIQQLPEQVVEAWDFYKPMIGASLPPYVEGSQQAMTNILTAISVGHATVWSYVKEDKVQGILVTYIHSHDLTRQKQLEIYSAYADITVTEKILRECLDVIKRYARAEGCRVIIGYSDQESWVRFLRMYGADTSFSLIEIPLV